MYPWGCSRLIWIPKPGTKKERPLTIPPFADKLVQEAIRMVLEPIYEPEFQKLNCSFGFRARVGTHQAIVSISETRNTQSMNRVIEGDISSAYPNLNRETLLNILGERIKDKAFLKLIKDRMKLDLFDTKDKKYKTTFLGLPLYKGGH